MALVITRCAQRVATVLASVARPPARINFDIPGALPRVPCLKFSLNSSRVSCETPRPEGKNMGTLLKAREVLTSSIILPQPPNTPHLTLSPDPWGKARCDFLILQATVDLTVDDPSEENCKEVERIFAKIEGVLLSSVRHEYELEKLAQSLIIIGRKFYKEGPVHGMATAYFFLSKAWDLLGKKNDFLLGHQLFTLCLFDVTRIQAHSKLVFSLLGHPDFLTAPCGIRAALYSDAAIYHVILSGPLPAEERQKHLVKAIAYYNIAAKLDTPFQGIYVNSNKRVTSLWAHLPPCKNLGFVDEAARSKTFVSNFEPSYSVNDGGPVNLSLWSLVDTKSPKGKKFLMPD